MRTLLALLCFAPATALAGGFFIPNPNARELALAQSDVAAQTGPEAVSMNAAALAGRAGLAVSATGQMLANQSSWQDASLGSAKTLNGPVFPPAIYASYGGKLPNDMAFGIGAGFHVMGGGSMEWPTGWPGATRIQKVTQNAFQTTVGAGLAVLPQLKLGASLVYYRVVEELSQQISFASSVGNATLGLAGGDFSFGLGAELAVPKLPVTIGASYRHQGSMTLSGKVHFEQVPAAFQAQLLDQGAKSDLILPSELFVGFAWRTVKTVRVMGSWSWENWKKYGDAGHKPGDAARRGLPGGLPVHAPPLIDPVPQRVPAQAHHAVRARRELPREVLGLLMCFDQPLEKVAPERLLQRLSSAVCPHAHQRTVLEYGYLRRAAGVASTWGNAEPPTHFSTTWRLPSADVSSTSRSSASLLVARSMALPIHHRAQVVVQVVLAALRRQHRARGVMAGLDHQPAESVPLVDPHLPPIAHSPEASREGSFTPSKARTAAATKRGGTPSADRKSGTASTNRTPSCTATLQVHLRVIPSTSKVTSYSWVRTQTIELSLVLIATDLRQPNVRSSSLRPCS
jgi:hypothetical protein